MTLSIAMMMNMTDEELLCSLEDKRHQSPILFELTRRLRKHIESEDKSKVNDKIECPVCMANLQVDIDWGNNMFTVKTVTV